MEVFTVNTTTSLDESSELSFQPSDDDDDDEDDKREDYDSAQKNNKTNQNKEYSWK